MSAGGVGMDLNTVFTVLGALAVAVLGAVGTYVVQSRVSGRERRWAAEAEDRRIQRESETERRTTRRELVSNKLRVVEEDAETMMFLTALTVSEAFGESIIISSFEINSEFIIIF